MQNCFTRNTKNSFTPVRILYFTAENYARKGLGVQQCPQCETFVSRMNNTETVRCTVCTKKNKTGYDFCWSCLHESNGATCMNKDCDGIEPRVRILRHCPQKTVGMLNLLHVDGVRSPMLTKGYFLEYTHISVPSIRACPKCGILIDITGGCKQISR